MTIEDLKAALPAYAKDLKLNLSSILREEALSEQQLWGALVATAIASRNAATIAAVEEEAGRHLSPEALQAAKAAAAIMSMNNVYYRFVHLAGSDDYKTMPARLRMNVIANPGVERADFELWSLAVSAVNGCGLCIESHEQELRKAGIANTAIQAAVRVAAIVHAVSVVVEAEGQGAEGAQAAA